MKIDSHQHFWQYDAQRDAWITPNMAVIQRDFLPQDLAPILHANGIDGCVAVQADQSIDETYFLLDCAENHELVKGVVGWIDLRADNIVEQLDTLSQYKKLKGFRHIVQGESDEQFMLRPAFQRGIQALEDFGYTYDILIYPHQLAMTKKFVNLFANQPFVIDHIAKPYIKQGLIDKWKQEIIALAEHENVSCKISGIITEADWGNWHYDEIKPYLDAVFEAFGTDRLLFGSDWPVCLLAGQYEQVTGILHQYMEGFSENEKAKVWGDNAVRFYSL